MKIFQFITFRINITNSINHNFGRIRIPLPIQKILTFHNVMILIKSVINENKCYYNISSEKGSRKDKSDTRYF